MKDGNPYMTFSISDQRQQQEEPEVRKPSFDENDIPF